MSESCSETEAEAERCGVLELVRVDPCELELVVDVDGDPTRRLLIGRLAFFS